MDIYKLKFTKLQLEILRLFCIKSGAKLSKRDIANELKVSPTAINKALKKLIKEKYLLVTPFKNMHLIYLNLNEEKVIQFKRVENLRVLYESKLVKFLKNNFPGTSIVLFGSYSKGEDIWYKEKDVKNSDIDIAIIGTKHKKINLLNFEKTLKRKINVNFYENWKIHKHLKENILNGIILKDGVEL